MKRILLLGTVLLNCLLVAAQHINIQKDGSQIYIAHKVAAKETLYSLGRTYHLTPKEIATANKISADAGLRVGQLLKIPLKKNNFVQNTPKSKKGLEPVYHTIKKGESLNRLSKAYNNVKEADLKKWNKMSKNVVQVGQELIVGYVKISSDGVERQQDVASNTKSKTDTSKNTAANKPLPQQEHQTKVVTYAEPPIRVEQKQETEPSTGENTFINTTSNTSADESFFAGNYSINAANAQEKVATGSAATFKSTSGWTDRKYYVLVNEIAPETIVKVTVNGKSIYAKVLESLPDLKDNKGLICRLSNAAASALGVTDAKFAIELSFYE